MPTPMPTPTPTLTTKTTPTPIKTNTMSNANIIPITGKSKYKHTLHLFLIVVILLLALLQVSCDNKSNIVEAKVNDYLAQNKYKECIIYLDTLIKADPKDSYNYAQKGYVLIQEGKPDEAIEYLMKANDLEPDNDSTLNNISWAYNDLHKYKEALNYSLMSLKITPNDPVTLANKANALRGLGKLKEAISAYDESLKNHPNYTISLYGKGLSEFDLNEYTAAIQTLETYTNLKPSNTDAYLVLGEAYYNIGEFKKAIKNLDNAIKYDTQNTEVYYYKGFCYKDQGKYAEAIKMFDTVIKATPDDSDAYYQKGMSLYYLGKYKASLDNFEQSIYLDPKYSYSYAWKGKNYLKLKDYKTAMNLANKALALDPSNTFALCIQARIYYAMGASNTALKILDKALMLDPDYLDLYLDKASILSNDGQYHECISFIEAAFRKEKFKDDIDLRWYLAESYSGIEKHNISMEIYDKLVKELPSNDSIINELAWEYYYLQDYIKAEKMGTKALSLNPKNEDAKALMKKLKYNKQGDNIKLPDFVRNNYLYLKQSKNFAEASKLLKAKKVATQKDIAIFLNAVVHRSDRFTYFITGHYYDNYIKSEETSHISTKTLNPNLLLLKIPSFEAITSDEVKNYLSSLKFTETKTLVIDLRDNPGGLILNANAILDMLLPKCTSSYLIYGDNYRYTYSSDSQMVKFKKIIVMVNENSASSSELMALSLKKHLSNVTIIGHKTFGKGVGQEVYENKRKKFVLLLTSFKWYVENENVTKDKLTPDIIIKGTRDTDYFDYINSITQQINILMRNA